MKYIILHGAFGTPEDNWFQYLKEGLIENGQDAYSPAFPVDTWDSITNKGIDKRSEIQNLDNWLNLFEKEVYPLIKDEKACVVCHSISCLFLLHAVSKFSIALDSAIFVSPFLEKLNKSWQIDSVNATFYKTNFDFKMLQTYIPLSYSLYSDNDPYVDMHFATEFSNYMKSSSIIIRGGGHLNATAGYTTFPLLQELCKTRINII